MPALSRTLLLPFLLAGVLAWSSGSASAPGAKAEQPTDASLEAEFKHHLVKAYAQVLWDQASWMQSGSTLYANTTNKWPTTPSDLTPDWLLYVPTPPNIEVLALKNEKELDAYSERAVAGAGKWEMLHDKAGTLVYVKLEGVSLTVEVCSELENTRNGPGSESGKAIPSVQLDNQKFNQCAASGEGEGATLSYFSRNPESPSPESACEALALYNASRGTSYTCRPTPSL